MTDEGKRIERLEKALAWAWKEAQGWKDECHGTPIEGEMADEVDALLVEDKSVHYRGLAAWIV